MRYTYSKGNPSYIKRTNNSKTQTFGFTYDILGRVKTATYADRRKLAYVCNGEGQLHSLTETNGSTLPMGYEVCGS